MNRNNRRQRQLQSVGSVTDEEIKRRMEEEDANYVPSNRELRPMPGWLVIRVTPLGKTAGGLIVPDSAKEKNPRKVHVVAASKGWYDHGVFVESQVKPGDHVVIGSNAMTINTMKDDKYLALIRETEIIAIDETPEESGLVSA